MIDPYKTCPVYVNENYFLRLVEISDAPDLLLVYSDEKAVPFFNSDNCNGDNFYYTSLKRMQDAINFWLWAYKDNGFVRWTIIDKRVCQAVGTIELFHRRAKDYFNDCGLLRLDLKSSYEREESIFEILSMVTLPAFDLFQCEMIATKVPSFAVERKRAAKRLGFVRSKESLIGGEDQKVYTDYYILQKNKTSDCKN